jgi:hypothetical protein
MQGSVCLSGIDMVHKALMACPASVGVLQSRFHTRMRADVPAVASTAG